MDGKRRVYPSPDLLSLVLDSVCGGDRWLHGRWTKIRFHFDIDIDIAPGTLHLNTLWSPLLRMKTDLDEEVVRMLPLNRHIDDGDDNDDDEEGEGIRMLPLDSHSEIKTEGGSDVEQLIRKASRSLPLLLLEELTIVLTFKTKDCTNH